MICKHCGAPMDNYICEYCGSREGMPVVSTGYKMMLLSRLLNDDRYNRIKKRMKKK